MEHEMELKEAAIAMEKKIAQFYRGAAAKAADGKVREVLEYLAEEEDRHAEDFETLASVETHTECLNEAFEGAGEILWWLWEDQRICIERVRDLASSQDVLQMGIQTEKDSIIFYHTLLKTLRNEAVVEQVQDILEKEYDHLKQLHQLLGLLEKSSRGA